MPSNQTRTPQQAAGPNLKLIVGVIVGVLLLVVAAVAFSDGGDDDVAAIDPEAPSQYGIITTTGDPLPGSGDGEVDPAIGMVPPTVISERSNEQVRLEPGEEDQPVMVAFLAHWCPHCQRELPILVELAEAGAFDGIRTVAVLTSTTPERGNFPPSAWLDDEGWTGDRLFDDERSTVAANYGLASFPLMVFLDADGEVVGRLAGEATKEQIVAAVAAAEA